MKVIELIYFTRLQRLTLLVTINDSYSTNIKSQANLTYDSNNI